MSIANLFICGFLRDDPVSWNVFLGNLGGPHPHNSLSGGESDEQCYWRRTESDFGPRTL